MSVRDFEMRMCSGMQIRQLREELEQYKETGLEPGKVIAPRIPAAPRDDSLFDCMNIGVKSEEDGTVVVVGEVVYWNPHDGYSQDTIAIRTFATIGECVDWLNSGNASEECADKL